MELETLSSPFHYTTISVEGCSINMCQPFKALGVLARHLQRSVGGGRETCRRLCRRDMLPSICSKEDEEDGRVAADSSKFRIGAVVFNSLSSLFVGWQGDGLSLAELHPLIVPQYKEIMEQEARRFSNAEAERTHSLYVVSDGAQKKTKN